MKNWRWRQGPYTDSEWWPKRRQTFWRILWKLPGIFAAFFFSSKNQNKVTSEKTKMRPTHRLPLQVKEIKNKHVQGNDMRKNCAYFLCVRALTFSQCRKFCMFPVLRSSCIWWCGVSGFFFCIDSVRFRRNASLKTRFSDPVTTVVNDTCEKNLLHQVTTVYKQLLSLIIPVHLVLMLSW